MSRIYIKEGGDGEGLLFELTATQVVSVQSSGRATKSPVEGRFSVSDAFIRENDVIKLTGILTGALPFTPTLAGGLPDDGFAVNDRSDFIRELDRVQKSGEPVRVVFGIDGEFRDNCVITQFSYERKTEMSNGYTVTLTLEQIRVQQRAEFFRREVEVSTEDKKVRSKNSSTLVAANAETYAEILRIDASGRGRDFQYEQQSRFVREEGLNVYDGTPPISSDLPGIDGIGDI